MQQNRGALGRHTNGGQSHSHGRGSRQGIRPHASGNRGRPKDVTSQSPGIGYDQIHFLPAANRFLRHFEVSPPLQVFRHRLLGGLVRYQQSWVSRLECVSCGCSAANSAVNNFQGSIRTEWGSFTRLKRLEVHLNTINGLVTQGLCD
jgi:hypothetical protein